MNTLIEYYIFCFDRYLLVTVRDADKTIAESILDNAYDNWQELDTGECCEEYMLNCLTQQGIHYSADI